MSSRKVNSRALRQLALISLTELSEKIDLYDVDRGDLATSLVRQWITCDGKALLLFGEEQIRANLVRSPQGAMTVAAHQSLSGWPKILREDWRIHEDELREIFSQLNCGQSIEVVNQDGLPLRLWVDPKEGSFNVDSLGDESALPRSKPDFHKFALHALQEQFGQEFATDELDALAASVTRQWQHFDGHACLFLNGSEQLCFQVKVKPEGGCVVNAGTREVHLEPLLHSIGVTPEELPEAIAHINLGQQFEFRDQDGVPSLLSHDPKTRQIAVTKSKPVH